MGTKAASNPFVFSRAVAPAEAIDRPNEVADLLRTLVGGNNVTLYGPRRLGKTSLLAQLAAAASRQRLLIVRVDLSDVLGAADVAARLEQAYRTLPGRAGRLVGRELGGLGLTTPVGGISVQRRSTSPDPVASVHSLLEVPARLAERTSRRALVVLDEFQALAHLPGLDGVFRSHLQHHERVSYMFCGSEPSLLRALFEDRARPLFGQAEMRRLGRIPYEAAHDFVVERFEATGKDPGDVVPELVALSELHPQRLMLIAHHLWEQVPRRRAATLTDLRLAYDGSTRAVATELRYLWDGLSANERRVVAVVASGVSPYARAALTMAGLVSRSSADRALKALEARAIVERDEAGELRIVDPLLARWTRIHGGARRSVFVVPRPKGGFTVTDGPSLAFARSEHRSLADAEAEADRLAGQGRGADVMIFDTDDANDLPGWAVAGRRDFG